jgi:glycosyltransferase involved in cell wall biosynthesis
MLDRLQVGGTETQLVSLIRNLDCNRIEPSLCLLDGQDPVSRTLEPPNCPVLRLGVRSLMRPSSLRKMRELAAYLHRQRIDVLQVHFPDSTYLGIAAAMLARVPCVVRTRRGFVYWSTFAHRTFGRFLDGFYNCLCVDAMVTNSNACRRAILEQEFFAPKWIEVLSNGVDLQRFENATPRPPSTAKRRVGLVAGLRPVKNIEIFVRAAKIVCDADDDVVFQIAGEGPLRPALEALIQDLGLTGKVNLLGAGQDVPSFLAGLDAAVLCSQSESLPNAVLEYMAAGKAIVATAVGGIPELIEHERQGLLVPPDDADALAQAVLRLLRDRTLAAQLGASGRCRVQHYGSDAATRRYEQFFQDLARQSAAYRRRHRRDLADPTTSRFAQVR